MKAHDVRKLATCSACKELGCIEDVEGVAPLVAVDAALIHPACLFRRSGAAAILALPKAGRDRVRISDVPKDVIWQLMLMTDRP